MKEILLPKGLKKLRDPSGVEADYDIPLLVFAHGNGDSTLEQLVLSLYFRGGDVVIDRPYVVRQIEQPLTKFYANQLAIRDVEQQPFETLDNVAKYLASEHVLVVPSLCSHAVSQIRDKYCQATQAFEQLKEKRDIGVDVIFENFREAIVPATRLRVPEIISLFFQFQAEFQGRYKRPNDPKLGANFDYLRRVVERSIQGTLNSSINTMANLLEDFDKHTTLKNARLIDVFARQHVLLGFTGEKVQFYNYVRDAYIMVAESTSQIEDKISAYSSLIIFDLLLDDNESAKKHIQELKKMQETHAKIAFMERLLADGNELWPYISKLAVIGLEKHYYPDLLDILDSRVADFKRKNTILSPFPVDVMEKFIEYAKRTKLYNVFYQKDPRGTLYRCFVFNQDPHIRVSSYKGGLNKDDRYVIVQTVKPGFFRFPDFVSGVTGRDDMIVEPDLWRNPKINSMLFGSNNGYSVDSYLFSVPEIQQRDYSPGSRTIVTLPTRPRLPRAGMDGTGPVDVDKLSPSKIS